MSEIQVSEQTIMENIKETNKTPVIYANLLSKLKQNINSDTNTTNNKKIFTPTETKYHQIAKPRYYRLSPEEYLTRLENCQKSFFAHLNEYLKKEAVMKSKSDDNLKITKTTNLEKIKCGQNVNVMKLFLNDDIKYPQHKYIKDLKYLDNLVSNKEMNFVLNLSNYMSAYGISTSFKGKNYIILHSPYVMV